MIKSFRIPRLESRFLIWRLKIRANTFLHVFLVEGIEYLQAAEPLIPSTEGNSY